MFLYSQVIINSLKLLLLFFGMRYGVMGMLTGHVMGTYIGCAFLTYLSGKLIGYGLKEQVRDLFPAFLLALIIGAGLYFMMNLLNTDILLTILIVTVVYGSCYLLFSWMLNLKGFVIYKEIVRKKGKR